MSLQVEADYSRWQLLSNPVSLDTFNKMPQLTPMFFEYSLRLGKNTETEKPIIFRARGSSEHTGKGEEMEETGEKNEEDSDGDFVEIDIWAWEVVRYKYKFFEATEVSGA